MPAEQYRACAAADAEGLRGGYTPDGSSCYQPTGSTPTAQYGCDSGWTVLNGQCTYKAPDKAATVKYVCGDGSAPPAGGACAAGVQSTAYVYLGGKLIAETVVGGSTQYVHTDALGSPVARTGPTKNVISRTRYEPYGYVAQGQKPSAGTSQIGFTGHVQDGETELVYMQQRYYDPIAGRFLSVDPVVTDANTGKGFGLYTYVDNNPYAKIDPDGRDPKDCSENCVKMRAISDAHSLGRSTTSAIDSFATGGYGSKFSQSVSAGNYGQAALNLGAGVAYGLANVATLGEGSAVVGALKGVATKEITTLYRAVTQAELKQIQKTGAFAAGENSLGGKWFAEAADHARQWGNVMNGKGASTVLEVQLPRSQADQLMRMERLDGIGPARYGELEQLRGAIIKALGL